MPSQYVFEVLSFLNPSHAAEKVYPKNVVSNGDLHLIHVVAGGCRGGVGEDEFEVTTGDVMFVPPFTDYFVWKRRGVELGMLNIHFHLSEPGGMSILETWRLPPSFRPNGHARIHKRLRKLYSKWDQRRGLDRLVVAAALNGLVTSYFKKHGLPGDRNLIHDPQMLGLRTRLEREAEEAFQADQLARSVHMSVSQMNRRFRSAFGVSPKGYWQKVRQARIQYALRYSSLSLNEISDQFGFSSYYYFLRWFKKMEGISPSAYRRGRKLAL